MPFAIKLIIAFNLVGVVCVGVFAYVLRFELRPAVFPPSGPVESYSMPKLRVGKEIEALGRKAPVLGAVPRPAEDIDLSIRPWDILPDGSVRLRE